MNRSYMARMLLSAILLLLLAACSADKAWEHEEVTEVSDRIMADLVEATWSHKPGSEPEDGTIIQVRFTEKDGKPIEQYDINHEKLLHLIIISKDLSYFNHVHPEYVGNGTFEIANVFPAGGEYRFIADFKPTGGDSMSKLYWANIEGEMHAPRPIVPETEWVDAANGKLVELAIDELGAKEDTVLNFAVRDELTGDPVTDLETYLGAIGHVVILSEDGERYVHVHAEEDQGSGPKAEFETEFPKEGIYKIWGQFQHNGEVFTVSYVVDVPRFAE